MFSDYQIYIVKNDLESQLLQIERMIKERPLLNRKHISQFALTSASSSSELGSFKRQAESSDQLDQSFDRFQKEIKRKDKKINQLSQKLKKSDQLAQFHRSKCIQLQYDLNFFKAKIQQQASHSTNINSEIQTLNITLNSLIAKIIKLLENKQENIQYFNHCLEQSYSDDMNLIKVNKTQKLLDDLSLKIDELIVSFQSFRKGPENKRTLCCSANGRIQLQKKQSQLSNEKQKQQIKKMKFDQLKVEDLREYKEEIQNLRGQREYTKQLLATSQREKFAYFNKIYKNIKQKLKINFQTMTKSDLIQIIIQLYNKIEDLQSDKTDLTKSISQLQSSDRKKYQHLLKKVQNIDSPQINKISKLKRLGSLPYN